MFVISHFSVSIPYFTYLVVYQTSRYLEHDYNFKVLNADRFVLKRVHLAKKPCLKNTYSVVLERWDSNSAENAMTGINKFKYKAINLFKVDTDVIELSVTKGISLISYSNVRSR